MLRFKEAAINAKDKENGYTPLHRAVLHGQLDVAHMLVSDFGANMNIYDGEGQFYFSYSDQILQNPNHSFWSQISGHSNLLK